MYQQNTLYILYQQNTLYILYQQNTLYILYQQNTLYILYQQNTLYIMYQQNTLYILYQVFTEHPVPYSWCFTWTCVELCQILFASPPNDSVTDISTHCLVKISFEFSLSCASQFLTIYWSHLPPLIDLQNHWNYTPDVTQTPQGCHFVMSVLL